AQRAHRRIRHTLHQPIQLLVRESQHRAESYAPARQRFRDRLYYNSFVTGVSNDSVSADNCLSARYNDANP
ncbi:MAG: hypothetical protein ACKVU4_15745, partial [Phycisphaerales bacterium]